MIILMLVELSIGLSVALSFFFQNDWKPFFINTDPGPLGTWAALYPALFDMSTASMEMVRISLEKQVGLELAVIQKLEILLKKQPIKRKILEYDNNKANTLQSRAVVKTIRPKDQKTKCEST